MPKHVLKASEIPIGKPTNWDIFDSRDRVLLRKGMTVRSYQQVLRLVDNGAFYVEESTEEMAGTESTNKPADVVPPAAKGETNEVLSPFDSILEMAKNAASIYKQLTRVVPDTKLQLPERLLRLSRSVEELCDYDLDATLGAMHLWHEIPYVVSHPVNTAILCRIIADRLGWDAERKIVLMAAALTSNIGMYDLQHALADQDGPLNDAQKDAVAKHSMRSAVLLKRWGVTNRRWLEIVLQHHERIDGKGYPRKLVGDKFITEARILGLADRYHALLAPRKNRKGLTPTEAINKLFRDRGKEVDNKLAEMFISELGIYPPGSAVKLKNGETAIVTRRGKDDKKPEVKSFLNDRNVLYPELKERDPSHSFYEIVAMTKLPTKFKPDIKGLWGYNL